MYDDSIRSTVPAQASRLSIQESLQTEFRRHAVRAFKVFGASVVLFILGGTIAAAFPELRILAGTAFGFAFLAACLGLVQGIRALSKPKARPIRIGLPILVVVFPIVGGVFMSLGALSALLSTATLSRGRQLRRRGRVLLPKVMPMRTWLTADVFHDGMPSVHPEIAEQWRENGRTEHASVAAFARLTLDLMVLGAPPRLIKAAQEDALDEIRHTELCFSLAHALDGKEMSPGPFPEARLSPSRSRFRTVALAELAVDSLVDGALHEGLSAAVIAKLAQRTKVQKIRSMLMAIARDEGRHAAHGWDVVEWCLAQEREAVASALRGAMLALPERAQRDRPAAAMNGEWESFGIHGQALEDQKFARMRASLQARVAALLGEETGRAAA